MSNELDKMLLQPKNGDRVVIQNDQDENIPWVVSTLGGESLILNKEVNGQVVDSLSFSVSGFRNHIRALSNNVREVHLVERE